MKKYFIPIFMIIPIILFAANGPSSSLWGLFKLGGIWMYFLLFLSIAALGFIIEKFYSFYKAKLNTKTFFIEYNPILEKKDPIKLKAYFSNSSHLISKVLSKGLQGNISKIEFESRIERASSIEVNELGRGLNILATIGSVAPLIGFLGTVAGMIKAFGNIAAADEVSAQLVAGGIYTALTTTAYGLIIAIPAIAMYNYFVHKIDNFIADIEKVVNQLLNKGIIK